MPADMDLNNLEVGDWVHVPDTLYPFEASGGGVYGSVCRSAVVTRSYMDGVVTIMFQEMRDMSDLRRTAPFTYESNIYSDELLRIMTAEEYQNGGVPATETPHVMGVGENARTQPRDAQGRFTSANTTERPTVSQQAGIDTTMAAWTAFYQAQTVSNA